MIPKARPNCPLFRMPKFQVTAMRITVVSRPSSMNITVKLCVYIRTPVLRRLSISFSHSDAFFTIRYLAKINSDFLSSAFK